MISLLTLIYFSLFASLFFADKAYCYNINIEKTFLELKEFCFLNSDCGRCRQLFKGQTEQQQGKIIKSCHTWEHHKKQQHFRECDYAHNTIQSSVAPFALFTLSIRDPEVSKAFQDVWSPAFISSGLNENCYDMMMMTDRNHTKMTPEEQRHYNNNKTHPNITKAHHCHMSLMKHHHHKERKLLNYITLIENNRIKQTENKTVSNIKKELKSNKQNNNTELIPLASSSSSWLMDNNHHEGYHIEDNETDDGLWLFGTTITETTTKLPKHLKSTTIAHHHKSETLTKEKKHKSHKTEKKHKSHKTEKKHKSHKTEEKELHTQSLHKTNKHHHKKDTSTTSVAAFNKDLLLQNKTTTTTPIMSEEQNLLQKKSSKHLKHKKHNVIIDSLPTFVAKNLVFYLDFTTEGLSSCIMLLPDDDGMDMSYTLKPIIHDYLINTCNSLAVTSNVFDKPINNTINEPLDDTNLKTLYITPNITTTTTTSSSITTPTPENLTTHLEKMSLTTTEQQSEFDNSVNTLWFQNETVQLCNDLTKDYGTLDVDIILYDTENFMGLAYLTVLHPQKTILTEPLQNKRNLMESFKAQNDTFIHENHTNNNNTIENQFSSYNQNNPAACYLMYFETAYNEKFTFSNNNNTMPELAYYEIFGITDEKLCTSLLAEKENDEIYNENALLTNIVSKEPDNGALLTYFGDKNMIMRGATIVLLFTALILVHIYGRLHASRTKEEEIRTFMTNVNALEGNDAFLRGNDGLLTEYRQLQQHL